MARTQKNTGTGRILENILFLAEVFGDRSNGDIPNVPFIELARSFELSRRRGRPLSSRRKRDWVLWK